jgi:hypothetical protein
VLTLAKIVLSLQIVLGIAQNMGMLLSTEDENNWLIEETEMNTNNNCGNNSSSDTRPSSFRCFQVVFATLHSLSDYYGIQHSDFPPHFELQLVIDSALGGLSRKPGQRNVDSAFHSKLAPCA